MKFALRHDLGFLALLFVILLSTGTVAYSQATPTLDSEEVAFLNLINNYRAQNGVGPLQLSVALVNSSRWMSNDMATHNNSSHTDSLGRDVLTRLAAFGYNYNTYWGENIIGGGGDSAAQTAFNGWQTACDADGSGNCTYAHRQNMLNGNFKVIGIGRVFNSASTYGWYWTTDFGGYVDQTMSPTTTAPLITAVPTIVSFTANPSTVAPGQPVLLTWSVLGATGVSLDGGIGDVTNLTTKFVSLGQSGSYTLTATNSAGTATARVIITVTPNTPAPDSQQPSTPNITSAVAKSSNEVDLTWSPSTDNVAVTGYQVLRNGAAIASVPASVQSYVDTAVSASTPYTYTVKAFDAAGNYSSPSNSAQVSTPGGAVSCGPATNAFTGCYYASTDFTGNPVLSRTDSQITFDWGTGSPDRSLVSGNFSIRWQGNITLDSGNYVFTTMTSDGVRLYVDGNLLIDRWRDQPIYVYTGRATLSQGSHLIVMEYYAKTGTAVANLGWQNNSPVTTPVPVISLFTATPSSVNAGQGSTLSWSVSGATTITIDNGVGDVSGVTSKSVSPSQTTTYTLTATNGGGSSTTRTTVTVNAVAPPPTTDSQAPSIPAITSAVGKSSTEVDLVWTASTDNVAVAGYQIFRNGAVLTSVPGASLTYADKGVAAGTAYTYAVKAFDAAGNYSNASNSVQVTTPSSAPAQTCGPATNAFTGCYFPTIDLSGTPSLIRTDAAINFDWGTGSPDKSLVSGNFSIRWQGNITLDAGNYTFTTMTSDGVRLSVDGNTIIDRWRDQPIYVYNGKTTLSQGTHLIVMEYYAKTGTAVASLSWQNNSPVTTPVPVISMFTATPSSINAGQSATLSWSVSGATTVAIDNGVGDVSSVTSRTVSPSQTTTYILTATNGGGSSTSRTTVTVTAVAPPPDSQAPSTPTLTSAVGKSSTEVDLTWTASTDNVAVTSYQISRNGTVLTSVPGTVLTYADKAVSANTAYSYSVKAFDAVGNASGASNAVQVTTPNTAPVQTCAPATNAFTGCYYTGINLSGNPALIRTDNPINFDWGTGSPDKSLVSGNFSIRWQGNITLDAGNYIFTTMTSDGVRLYVDGNIIIDRWRDQPIYVYTGRSSLTQGNHLIVMEYYAKSGTAVASLSWQNSSPVTTPAPVVSLFTATPSSINAGQSASLSWSISGATSVNIDNGVGDVSGVTSRSVSPTQTTTYTLTATNSGGSTTARTSVAINAIAPPVDIQPPSIPTLTSAVARTSSEVDLIWTASTDNVGVAVYQITRNGVLINTVTAGSLTYADTSVNPSTAYTYSVKAVDASGNASNPSNSVQVTTPSASSGQTCTPATNAFTGCYYNSLDLSGNPVFIKTDSQINFNWGSNGPDPSVTGGSFSVRWQGNFVFSQGTYTFTVVTSDGMRLFVDGNSILDQWRDQSPRQYGVQTTLTGGSHLITVEYYEHTNGSVANVSWQVYGGIGLPANVAVGMSQSIAFPITLPAAAPAGGVTVTMSSSDTSKVTVTPSVFIAAGAMSPATQPQVNGVNMGTCSVVAAAPGYTAGSGQVQVTAGGGGGSSFFSPSSLTFTAVGSQPLTLILSSSAPAGLTATLSSSNTAVASVPPTVTFATGATSAVVTVTGIAAGTATITATTPNIGVATATVTYTSLPGVSVTWYGACWVNATLYGTTGNFQAFDYALTSPVPVTIQGTLFFEANCPAGRASDNMNDFGATTSSGHGVQGFALHPDIVPSSAIYWVGPRTADGFCPPGVPCSGCLNYTAQTPNCSQLP